ncbi:c-type cytochrome [Limnobacter humi]|uniref:C-type cytochrome n=1 Tax=Limnobacter humi TaxID=1778671 RepID=A0ABT1WE58_9BURK|nr:c-type cytochrome [Limnobacter humi]MCQ8895812.1 c-type cytochrome [Limnobacter humi]
MMNARRWIGCAWVVAGCCTIVQAWAFEGLGRVATPAEIKAWDIDVRPDFKGIPKGRGSVQQGQLVWDAQCASCHGAFGESNEVFTPIVGGTTDADIQSGHVAALRTGAVPQRTTLMKVPTVSTLWDYVNRAMPWNAPKSLSANEVYAVTAYILNLGGIVPDDFELNQDNMAAVQNKMPNRHGMTQQHGLWQVSGKPDVKERRCMSNCVRSVVVSSSIPDYAADAHGNLMDQNRVIGPVRGQQTSTALAPKLAVSHVSAGEALFNAQGCTACHAVGQAGLGPAMVAVAGKYKDRSDAHAYLVSKIRQGGTGQWGNVPMPAQSQLSEHELNTLASWVSQDLVKLNK